MSEKKCVKSNISYNVYCEAENGEAISHKVKKGDIFNVIAEKPAGYQVMSICNKVFTVSKAQVLSNMYEYA